MPRSKGSRAPCSFDLAQVRYLHGWSQPHRPVTDAGQLDPPPRQDPPLFRRCWTGNNCPEPDGHLGLATEDIGVLLDFDAEAADGLGRERELRVF
jgi:hypothetical protein